MLGRIGFWAGAIVLGALLGAFATWWSIGAMGALAQQSFGPWRSNALAGSQAADPYTRAAIARTGLLALSARETTYFNLATDDRGEALDESCVYELAGGPMPARWWSVTIYAPDDYLPQNNDHAFSIDGTRVGDGDWVARVAPVRGDADNWISSRAAQRGFVLMLRLYQPAQEAREHPSTIRLPELRRISCPGAAS